MLAETMELSSPYNKFAISKSDTCATMYSSNRTCWALSHSLKTGARRPTVGVRDLCGHPGE
jgi:hypothetical protein